MAVIATASAALAALFPGLFGLDAQMGVTAGLVVLTIGLWASGVIPEYVTALVFFLIAMLTEVAPPSVVFAGFESAAWWLVFGGLIIGVAVNRTGLGKRLAGAVAGPLTTTYPRLIFAVVLVSSGLAFVMPSTMGRVILLLPIILALADRVGLAPDSNGRIGMVLAAAFSTYMIPAAILPANVPNMVMAGAAESLWGIILTYGDYLLLHMPVLGLVKGVALILVICRLYPDRLNGDAGVSRRPAPMTAEERRLAVLLAGTLMLWATDFLHGISPAWVALATALVCLLPSSGLVPPRVFGSEVNFASLFYVGGVLGLASLVPYSGLGDRLSVAILALMPLEPGSDAQNFASLSILATAIGTMATMPGIPAILTPLAGDLAAVTGWSLESVILTQVIGFSTVLLPYQVPPLVVALGIAGIPTRRAVAVSLRMAVITVVVIAPLDYLWWLALGRLP